MDVISEVEKFYQGYVGNKGVIGYSYLKEPIYFFEVRKTDFPVAIFQYSIHAREYITAYLAIEQINEFILSGVLGRVFFIPLVNPDGVKIALEEKPLYKANARGVDLNVNFDARWGTGESNTRIKGDQNYIGEFAFSEPESIALRDFTLKVEPDFTVSYHSKGEEIYYSFFQDGERAKRDLDFAKAIASVTGYEVKLTPNSAGGYKDWCIEKLLIPSLTIEVGADTLSHPIQKNKLGDIFSKNKKVVQVATEFIGNIDGT